MRKIGDALEGALGRKEVLRMARAQRVLRRWPEVVGTSLAARSRPDRYERGTVWVAVRGSAWAQELRMIRDRILERLRDMSGEPSLFMDIRFGVRPFTPIEPPIAKVVVEDRRADLDGLTIREIAERRMGKWRRENRG